MLPLLSRLDTVSENVGSCITSRLLRATSVGVGALTDISPSSDIPEVDGCGSCDDRLLAAKVDGIGVVTDVVTGMSLRFRCSVIPDMDGCVSCDNVFPDAEANGIEVDCSR